ncbi:MAG: tetratricopeptide repeat protein [Thioploca sp.]|nr:tetratricopeptide repeat protein [Thioploca sp.]
MNELIKNFEALLTQGQDNALLRFGLGNAYFKQKDFAQAAQHFAKAIEFNPKYSAAWKNYGKALSENQQIQEAIEVYTQGITVAEEQGDKQAAKEMMVFLKRLQKMVNNR